MNNDDKNDDDDDDNDDDNDDDDDNNNNSNNNKIYNVVIQVKAFRRKPKKLRLFSHNKELKGLTEVKESFNSKLPL